MGFLSRLFGKKETSSQRSYREVVALGGQNSDWVLNSLSEDSDVWQNAYALTARVRDLFKTNTTYIKYRELLWANIFGEGGIMLRMKVMETENRVVYSADEKAALVKHEQRVNRVRAWAAAQTGNTTEQYRAFILADEIENRGIDSVLRGSASVSIGQPDIYANVTIENAYQQWKRAEYCDVRKRRPYNALCQLRLISAVRDGDHFIRHIRTPKVNKFGYALQLINAEWVDRFYNAQMPNGNVVIMGIEYKMSSWGLGEPVAFHFIKRQANDWQFSNGGMWNFGSGTLHERVDASEIIHYARPVDADATRPAPWVAATIPKARQLDQYELAEVIAARAGACKTGWLYSDMVPEGGFAGEPPSPTDASRSLNPVEPGGIQGLPFGVKYQGDDPKHPNGNFETFRKGMVRSLTAGMPGGDYNVLASDLENINFSAGRLGRLDTNETSMLIQRFDIDTAERPIFEAWLEMALITGAVPLPFAKYKKFDKPLFQGRRWKQVDEVKAVNAAALRVANNMSSLSRENADLSQDFEEIAFERAEEKMLLESLDLPFEQTCDPRATAADMAEEAVKPPVTPPPAKKQH